MPEFTRMSDVRVNMTDRLSGGYFTGWLQIKPICENALPMAEEAAIYEMRGRDIVV